jgi:hypothetical protein
MLNISDLMGNLSTKRGEELVSFLNRRDAEGYNCFTLNHGEKEFPNLVIMVNDQVATASFFITRERMLQSQCSDLNAAGRGIHSFKLCAIEAPGPIASISVIPFADAVTIALEYMETRRCPVQIEWMDLA